MLTFVVFIALSLIMPFVGARSCWSSQGNCTTEAVKLDERSMWALNGSPESSWPGGKGWNVNLMYAKIPYCFASVNARTQLIHHVGVAIQMWMNALGGLASPETGHGLSFQEVVDINGQPMYCYFDDYQSFDQPGTWHFGIDKHTLSIHLKASGGAISTLGYYAQGQTGYHHVRAGLESSIALTQTVLAHELGHVMGFGHEHQRWDRDNYVRFNCERLQGYQDAINTALRQNAGMTMQDAHLRLCTDARFAHTLGFHSTEFIKLRNPPLYLTGYDLHSIMHYDTSAFMDHQICHGDRPWLCPLTTVDGYGIYRNTQPSPGDAHGVRLMYPWKP